MIRRFNYTGRKKLDLTRIDIRVSGKDGGVRRFDAELNLAGLALPEDASVFVEAYYGSSYMRFPFGTVLHLDPPGNRELTEINSGGVVFFRVKVVDSSRRGGCLVAEADRIAPKEVDLLGIDRICILPVLFKDLGPVVWRVNYDARTVLEVNNRLPGVGEGIKDLVRTDRDFFSLVWPAVVREVLTRILLVEGEERDWDDDGDDWGAQWIKFIRRIHPPFPPRYVESDSSTHDAVLAWIDDAVIAFCKANNVAERYGSGRAATEGVQ